MNTKKQKAAGNRVAIFGLGWAVSYIISLLLLKEFSLPSGSGFFLAFLPTLFFGLFIWNLSKAISKMDELEMRIYLEAGVIAFSLCLLMIMTLGLLDLVIELKKEDWGYRHLVPYFFVFYFLGLFWTRKKYAGHEE